MPFCHEVVWEGTIDADWITKLKEHKKTHGWLVTTVYRIYSAWGRWRLHHVIHKTPPFINLTDPSVRPSDREMRCLHGKIRFEECSECRGGFDHASPLIP